MDLAAGKSAKHDNEAETAWFLDQEHTKPHPSLFLEVECKSAEIKKLFWEIFTGKNLRHSTG